VETLVRRRSRTSHEAAAAADQTLGALEAYVFCAREDNTNIIPTLMIVCETALPS